MKVAVFGPTRVMQGERDRVFVFLSTLGKDVEIVTSSCKGWDKLGRDFAASIGKSATVIRASFKKGHDIGVAECNDEMARIADIGLTKENADTKGTLDMIKRLKKLGKIVYQV